MVFETTTDANGDYSFSELPADSEEYIVTIMGFFEEGVKVTLSGTSTVRELNVQLDPK